MTEIVKATFEDKEFSFREDGWFNATEAAARFGKQPTAWLRQRETAEYLLALAQQCGFKSASEDEINKISNLRHGGAASQAAVLRFSKKTGFVKTKQGSPEHGGGTWMHPKLGVAFARWLDVRFSIWCDMQIDNILRGKIDAKRMRHEAAASFKVMQDMLHDVRNGNGKITKPYHYSNEARLINYALTGEFKSVDRDSLPPHELDKLALFEKKNAILIGRGVEYKDRKKMLEQYALDLAAQKGIAA
jgi:hypothetical protein